MMTSRRFFEILLWALLVSFVTSCAGGKTAPRRTKKPGSVRDFSQMKEDFNPVDLNDDDIEIKDADVVSPNIDNVLSQSATAMTDTIGTGYRIQIIQTTDPQEAREVQKDAILRFEHEVYRAFDPPFYKVRVGDFANWNDAEQVQKLAIQKGFRDAWVIRTKIDMRKAYRAVDAW